MNEAWLATAVLAVALPAAAADLGDQLRTERQQLDIEQNVLTAPELREGQRQLDAIGRMAQSNPAVADQMLQSYRQSHATATLNRPVPGGAPTPGLAGPGDRY